MPGKKKWVTFVDEEGKEYTVPKELYDAVEKQKEEYQNSEEGKKDKEKLPKVRIINDNAKAPKP